MSERFLIVEDETTLRDSLKRVFVREGFEVEAAVSAEEALPRLEERAFDVILTDIILPGIDVIELLEQARQRDPAQIVVVMTAYATHDTAVRALRAGAYDFVIKPVIHEELKRIVRNALQARALRAENDILRKQIDERYGLDQIVGESAPMCALLAEVRKVADSRSNVLLLGETGTGKELFARAIHAQSSRREKPFVPINCSACRAILPLLFVLSLFIVKVPFFPAWERIASKGAADGLIVGIPKEIKDNEYRVSMTPGGLRQLVESGHQVVVQTQAGAGSGFSDADYRAARAELAPDAAAAWSAGLVVKVKEPLLPEYAFLRPDLILFTYLHLAAERELTLEMMKKGVTGIAYETVELPDGQLPLLKPMSDVAGRLAVQTGAYYLEKVNGGSGKLIGGVAGVEPARVTIIGGGIVGASAARIALGMGAEVTVLDRNIERLRHLEEVLHERLITRSADPLAVEESVAEADLLIGAVLVKGDRTPRVVTRAMVARMASSSSRPRVP